MKKSTTEIGDDRSPMGEASSASITAQAVVVGGLHTSNQPKSEDYSEREFNAEIAMHFLELARTGKHPASSSGEQRAFRLAKSLLKNLDDVTGIDASAIDGLCELIRVAPYGQDLVTRLLKQAVSGRRSA